MTVYHLYEGQSIKTDEGSLIMLHVPLALSSSSCLNDVDVVWGSKGSHGKNSFHCEAIMEDRRADVKLQNVDSPQADRSHLKIVMFI